MPKEEIKNCLSLGSATNLPWKDNNEFDLVLSITTLHNLYAYDLDKALREIAGWQKQVRLRRKL